jgi:hypothetical protein
MRFSSRANGVAERPQACTPVMPLRFSSRANVAARPQPLAVAAPMQEQPPQARREALLGGPLYT